MTNFVFDTNCIISAHLLPQSVTRLAYNKALEQGVLLYSVATLKEFAEVFARPKFEKYVPLEKRMKAVSAFEKVGFLTDVEITISACRDADDNKFLELAVSGKANYIITGDDDLLVLNPFQNTVIISPSNFIEKY